MRVGMREGIREGIREGMRDGMRDGMRGGLKGDGVFSVGPEDSTDVKPRIVGSGSPCSKGTYPTLQTV